MPFIWRFFLVSKKIFCSSATNDFSVVWTSNLSFYSGYDVASLDPVCKELADILLTMETSKYQTIYKKYMHKSRLAMATACYAKYRKILELVQKGLWSVNFLFILDCLRITPFGSKLFLSPYFRYQISRREFSTRDITFLLFIVKNLCQLSDWSARCSLKIE